jgi:predicted DNA-binding transcriptional regulator YafY
MERKRSDKDRRIRQADRLARVLRVLQLIQGRGRWNVTQIARELECSERTIHRDLKVLEYAEIRLEFDKEHGCYRLLPSARFPVLSLTEDELIGLATAATVMTAPGLNIGLGAIPTTRKLEATSQEEPSQLLQNAQQLIAALDLKLADHSSHFDTIRTIQRALLERKQLEGKYRSPYERKTVTLTLHPYRLALVKSAWYLIARPAAEAKPRSYRVHRFKSLGLVDEPARVPVDFELKAYFGNAWGVFRGDQSYDVELEFLPDAGEIVTETIWHPTQKVRRHKNGKVTLTFHVDGLNEIVRWVVGWSGRVKVVKPVELKSLVVQHFQAGLEMNQG